MDFFKEHGSTKAEILQQIDDLIIIYKQYGTKYTPEQLDNLKETVKELLKDYRK